MKITKGILLRYIVEDSKQAIRLEEAINSLPAIIELSDLGQPEESPKLFVTEGLYEIYLRPHGCRVIRSHFEEGVSAISNSKEFTVIRYQGIKYNITNVPLYE